MRFDKETTTKIIDEIEKEIYTQYNLSDNESDREAFISFFDISYYDEFGNEVDRIKKVYEYYLERYPDPNALSFEDMCRKSIIDIDRYEDDRVIINKGMFLFLNNDDILDFFEKKFSLVVFRRPGYGIDRL